MAIITNKEIKTQSANKTESITISPQEVNFIINKLQHCKYKGTEFEEYYAVMKKLFEIQRNLS